MPNKVVLPHVGEIDLASVDELYEASVTIGGREVKVSLAFDEAKGASVDSSVAKELAIHLSKVETYITKGYSALEHEFREGNGDKYCATREYIEHHADDEPMLDGSANQLAGMSGEEMLTRIHPKECIFFPLGDEDGHAAWVDFTIGEEFTQYVLSVRIGRRGEVTGIHMES